jgi:hypothetical protein
MPSSKQSSTHVPSGLLELVPSDEYLISSSVTPGTPVIGSFWLVSPDEDDDDAPDPLGLLLELAVVFVSLELLHAATASAATIVSSTVRRSRAWDRWVSMLDPSVGC